MAKEYLVEVVGSNDSTFLIIRADDIEFSIIKKFADRVTKASANYHQPTMHIREVTEVEKRQLEDE